jgi:hypothetical protein
MRIAAIEDKNAYDDFVKQNGSVFNTSNWLSLFDERVQLYGIFDKGQSLIGIFHLYVHYKYKFKFCINPPATPHCGLVYKNPSLNNSSKNSFTKDIINLFSGFLKAQRSSELSIALPPEVIDTQPLQWADFQVKTRYTYLIDLIKNADEIWDNFSSQRRKSIRKAESDQLEVKGVSSFVEIKSLVEKTFNRQAKKLNQEVVNKILFSYANPENAFGYVTYILGKPAATVFCIHDDKAAYYLLGGYDESNKHHGAGSAAMWAAIKHAKSMGLKTFNFNGSMLPKIEDYFREYGGELTPYYEVSKKRGLIKYIK